MEEKIDITEKVNRQTKDGNISIEENMEGEKHRGNEYESKREKEGLGPYSLILSS